MIPFVRARWFTSVSDSAPRAIDVVVIHTMEAPEKTETAEAVARFFQTLPSTRKASAHYNVDNNSIVQCVLDKDVAYAAPGNNHNGLQFEHAGFASQGKSDWADAYSQAMLRLSADLAAEKCKKYGIPVRWLSVADLKAGRRGFTSHANVSLAWHRSDHTDPGVNFPVEQYLTLVREALGEPKEDELTLEDVKALESAAKKFIATGTGPGSLTESRRVVFWALVRALQASPEEVKSLQAKIAAARAALA